MLLSAFIWAYFLYNRRFSQLNSTVPNPKFYTMSKLAPFWLHCIKYLETKSKVARKTLDYLFFCIIRDIESFKKVFRPDLKCKPMTDDQPLHNHFLVNQPAALGKVDKVYSTKQKCFTIVFSFWGKFILLDKISIHFYK